MNKVDVVTKVQAWIIANETVAAEHHARLVEQVVNDHLRDMCQKLSEAEDTHKLALYRRTQVQI